MYAKRAVGQKVALDKAMLMLCS